MRADGVSGDSVSAPRALLVDLNNFARYPTLSIGYLVAALRRDGIAVEVLCPLNHGVHPVVRERPEGLQVHLQRRVFFASHPLAASLHDTIRAGHKWFEQRPQRRVIEEVARAIETGRVDVVLLSAYLDHYPSVRAITARAGALGVPVLLGGPMFNLQEVAREWLDLPGLTAIFGGEADLVVSDLVRAVVAGGDISHIPGVSLPSGRNGPPARPLADLAALPTPDFDDFPWHRYPHRVVPVMTGRGCSWGRCLFCSDVVSANGRGFRARPAEAVLDEVEAQARRYESRDFICLDIKLNSDLPTWHGLMDGFQARVPGGRWIGTVHVQARGDNGLSYSELEAARRAGMARISFGLETGSQRVNNSMAKGTSLERTSQFITDAHRAGLSVRTTMMLGYPGETAQDVRSTIAFVRTHEAQLDRIQMSLFKAVPGTRFAESYEDRAERFPDLRGLRWDFRLGRARYRNTRSAARDYRSAKNELLSLVHRINRGPLRAGAEVFDGLM